MTNRILAVLALIMAALSLMKSSLTSHRCKSQLKEFRRLLKVRFDSAHYRIDRIEARKKEADDEH